MLRFHVWLGGRISLSFVWHDGGVAILRFVRWWDTETHDPAVIAKEIGALVSTLDWLFVKKKCLTFEYAYTKIMLEHLASPRLVTIRGEPKSIGGRGGQDVIQRALKHMSTWVSTVMEVLNAEFPGWSIMQSFAVLGSLSTSPSAQEERCLERFAMVFKLPLAALKRDVASAMPLVAAKRQKMPNMSNRDLWTSVCKELTRTAVAPALRSLLVRYGVYSGCTTSGVEHLHSVHDWLFTSRRGALSTSAENVEMKLITARGGDRECDIDATIGIAQEVWRKQFGHHRIHLCCLGKVGHGFLRSTSSCGRPATSVARSTLPSAACGTETLVALLLRLGPGGSLRRLWRPAPTLLEPH